MKTISVKLYTYAELDKEAQQKALVSVPHITGNL